MTIFAAKLDRLRRCATRDAVVMTLGCLAETVPTWATIADVTSWFHPPPYRTALLTAVVERGGVTMSLGLTRLREALAQL
jgi:hypothetical protein